MNISLFNFHEAQVRVVIDDLGNPWFAGLDVCALLGYANHNDAMGRHCKGVVKRYPLLTPGGVQKTRILSEGDTLRLIVNSTMPAAQEFEAWVFDEVLPTIRRTGRFGFENLRNKLMLEYQQEKAIASLAGKTLRRWQDKKPVIEERILAIEQSGQHTLLLN